MKQTLTAKLKLKTTPEQFAALRATQLAYRDALNFVSRYSFEHGKISSNISLHKGTYYDVRAQFHLPSQITCTVMREVAATYKGHWTKARKNAAARKAGHTKKRYTGLDTPPTFVSPTLTYQHGKDYSFKVYQQVSILTLDGRVVVSYQGYHEHITLLHGGAEMGTAKLWYDKAHHRYYLLVSFEIERPDPTPEQQKQVVGVDVGLRYLAVTSDSAGEPTFHSGKQVRNRANHYARLRTRLQRKGTRSATRRLIAISGRERRLKANANHTISRRIVQEHPHALIGIEQLTGIRDRTKRRTHRRKKNGNGVERASVKQRKSNRVYSQWSFAELHSMLAYKAVRSSSMVVRVDADYTSKGCPTCGHIDEANRPNKGLLFYCVNCHYRLHADLIGARNIVMRTLLVRQDWARTGQLSVAPGSCSQGPDVSVVEAKAARLKRYAELRWRPERDKPLVAKTKEYLDILPCFTLDEILFLHYTACMGAKTRGARHPLMLRPVKIMRRESVRWLHTISTGKQSANVFFVPSTPEVPALKSRDASWLRTSACSKGQKRRWSFSTPVPPASRCSCPTSTTGA